MNEAEPTILKKISADQPSMDAVKSESISMVRPTTPGMAISRATGINILQTAKDMTALTERLKNCGLIIEKTFHYVFSDASNRAKLLYCITTHGQYVMVEPPEGLMVCGGLSIVEQRVDVISKGVSEQIKEALKGIYTGYAYMAGGGIHYVGTKGAEPRFFGYEKYADGKSNLDVRTLSYTVIPAVHWSQLAEPSRLNTIDAHISALYAGSPLEKLVSIAGLSALLTSSGPITFFAPEDKILAGLLQIGASPEKVRSIVLAHIVMDRIDKNPPSSPPMTPKNTGQTLTPINDTSTMANSVTVVTALGQNKFEVHRSGGVVVGIIPLPAKDKKIRIVGDGIGKYNGMLYRIDSTLEPVAQNVQIPSSSDYDNVVTVFDINRTTMDIRVILYKLNSKKIAEMSIMLEFIQSATRVMFEEIQVGTDKDGLKLLADSNELLNMFLTREVPCTTRCANLDQKGMVVQAENVKFDKIVRAGNRLSSLKHKIEKMWLKVSRIDQNLHVDDPIGSVMDLEDFDE